MLENEIKSETIRARIIPSIKIKAEEILDDLGISSTQAITMFYKQIILNNGIPFDVRVPNKTTKNALKELENSKKLEKTTLSKLMKEFD